MIKGNGFATKADLRDLKNEEWLRKVDVLLSGIEEHRRLRVIWAEERRRTWDLLEKIAVKVGVPVE